jgi:hypothetical protein
MSDIGIQMYGSERLYDLIEVCLDLVCLDSMPSFHRDTQNLLEPDGVTERPEGLSRTFVGAERYITVSQHGVIS